MLCIVFYLLLDRMKISSSSSSSSLFFFCILGTLPRAVGEGMQRKEEKEREVETDRQKERGRDRQRQSDILISVLDVTHSLHVRSTQTFVGLIDENN